MKLIRKITHILTWKSIESHLSNTNFKNIPMKRMLLLFAFLFLSTFSLLANNLVLGSPSFSGNTVSFTIKWNNSWYVNSGPSNWDAVWVFVKRQHCAPQTVNAWNHEVLAASGHSVTGTQLQVDLPADKMGVYVRRSATGVGNINQATVTLTLTSNVNSDNISVYGIEMVNVPEGEFWIGNAPGVYNEWGFTDGNSENPKLITKTIQDNGIGEKSNYQKDNVGSPVSLPATFPLGYYGFYCMKYEITCGQFVSFLNSLTYNQQLRLSKDPNGLAPEKPAGTAVMFLNNNSFRVVIKTPGNGLTSLTPAVYASDATNDNNYDQEDDGQCLPISLGNKQFLAFLNWAALRPMTEFEYEKACRGPLTPVRNEYAWGSNDVLQFDLNNVSNRFKPNESLSNAGLGFTNLRTGTLFRAGIAATDTSNRRQAGATYYGIMDMTGSIFESVIGSLREGYDCNTFTATNGNGTLDDDANTNNPGWLEHLLRYRGGSWNEWPDVVFVSGRRYVTEWGNGAIAPGNSYDAGNGQFGGRGIRSF